MDTQNQNMNGNFNFINNPLLNQNYYNFQNCQINQNNFVPYFPQGMDQMNDQFNMNQNMNPCNMPKINLLFPNYRQSPLNKNNENMQNNNQYKSDVPLDFAIKAIKLFDINNLSNKQLDLIKAVIQFYKKKNNFYMNFENPLQIQYILNFLEAKVDICKYGNKMVEDPLYYINEQKKVINFINSNYIIYKVNIPIKITKFDLHTIARHYQSNKFVNTGVLLIYNDIVLKDDESSIDSISENDFIKIIDIRNYPDSSYLNSLQSNLKIGDNLNNFKFHFDDDGRKQNFILPVDLKICDLLKAFYLKNGLENNYCKLVCNVNTLHPNDETKMNEFFGSNINYIQAITISNIPYTFGKLITGRISYFENRSFVWVLDIGVLNSINFIISKNESMYNRKVKKLVIGDLVIKRDDKRTLLSLGIIKDFICLVDFEKP